MEKRLMTVVACLAPQYKHGFCTKSNSLVTLPLLRTEALLAVLRSRLRALTQVQLPILMVTSH